VIWYEYINGSEYGTIIRTNNPEYTKNDSWTAENMCIIQYLLIKCYNKPAFWYGSSLKVNQADTCSWEPAADLTLPALIKRVAFRSRLHGNFFKFNFPLVVIHLSKPSRVRHKAHNLTKLNLTYVIVGIPHDVMSVDLTSEKSNLCNWVSDFLINLLNR